LSKLVKYSQSYGLNEVCDRNVNGSSQVCDVQKAFVLDRSDELIGEGVMR